MSRFEIAVKVFNMCALPIIMTVILKFLQRKWKPFKECKKSIIDLIIGLLFGLCAIYGTEFGVNTGMAIVNTRDAAVLCAGMFFSGPSALIAAVVGSVERFLAPLWGVGLFTRWACSIATLCAGLVTFLLRRYFFEKKTPKWHQALAVGVFVEVFHLLLVFVTHMDDIHNAFAVVKSCSSYMIIMNGLSVMVAAILVTQFFDKPEKLTTIRDINTQFNIGIFAAMLVGFAISIMFTAVLENRLYLTEAENTLNQTIVDVSDQLEFASTNTDLEKAKIISQATKFRHIYDNGFVFVADKNGRIISDRASKEGSLASDFGFDLSTRADKLKKTFLDGSELLYSFTVFGDYFIVAAVPASEAKLNCELSMYIVFFMEMIVFAVLFLNVFYLIKSLVLTSLDDVNKGLVEITDGNLDTVLNVKKNAEFENLSNGINSTVTRLKKYIDEANAKMDAELEMAKTIQSSSVPTVFPKHSDGEIYASMITAKEVGGDFYDFFFVPPNNLFLLIADVSGKGIPAALFMMKAKTIIKNLARQTRSDNVGEILTQANEMLCESNDAEMFVTCWMGCVNLKNGHVNFANAGHNKPVLIKAGQKPQFLDEKVNLVLAGMEGVVYTNQEFDLHKNDVIFLYTDGITEATNVNEELFGDQRLLDALTSCSDVPEEICKKIMDSAVSFTGEAPQFDDMTELAFTYRQG